MAEGEAVEAVSEQPECDHSSAVSGPARTDLGPRCDCATRAERAETAIAALGAALHGIVSEPELDAGERLTRLETALAGIGAFLRSVAERDATVVVVIVAAALLAGPVADLVS